MPQISPDRPSPSLHLADAHARRAVEQLASRAGKEATYLVHAPGRVNLIGEHTDYNGGFVLPMAIELGIYIAATPREDHTARIWSGDMEGKPAEFDLSPPVQRGEPSWSNYIRGVIAGLQHAGVKVPGFDAVIHASLPAGGGLSSSAALEVATATLIEQFSGVTLDPVKKALICQKAEHVFAGTPCGIMDQFAVIFGQQGHLLLIDCHSQERELVPMQGGDASLLVINTMVKHELSDGGYKSRRADCEEGARLMGVAELREVAPAQVDQARELLGDRIFRRARHVTTENARTLQAVEALKRGEWSDLGQLMYASHASLRDDFEVSCSELDTVVELARQLSESGGVYGCRMTGGGFGGCCVALVDANRAEEVAKSIAAGYRTATNIEANIFASRPADGPTVLLHP